MLKFQHFQGFFLLDYNAYFDTGCFGLQRLHFNATFFLNATFGVLPVIFLVIASAFFFLFFLTAIFAVIPIVDILAPIDTVTIFVYVFILTGLVIETPFCHKRTSSILEDILQHFECGRFLGVFF